MCQPQAPLPYAHLSLCLTLSALSAPLGACGDRTPVIVEARVSPPSAALSDTPIGARLRAESGDGALRATLTLALSASALDDPGCPAARSDGAACVRAPLTPLGPDAERGAPWGFKGDFEGAPTFSPLLTGDTLFYRFEVTDADGDTARFPAEGAGQLIVGSLLAPLTLEQVTPPRGPTQRPTRLLIKGEGFTRAHTLSLSLGALPLTEVRVESPHLISALAPPHPTATCAPLRLESAGRVVERAEAYCWTPPPTLTLTPAEGPMGAPRRVLIEIGQLSLEGPELPVLLLDGEEIAPLEGPLGERAVGRDGQVAVSVLIPAGPEGEVRVAARGADGQISEAAYARVAPPTLSAISPPQGPDSPSTWVLIEGARLRRPGAVWFEGREALAVEVNDEGTRARALTPLHPGGLSAVRYVNPDGQWAELPRAYRFLGPPRVDGGDPLEVSRCGGGVVTLYGRNLSPGMQVSFNGVAAEVLSVADDGARATVRAPAGVPGRAVISVVAPDGRGDERADLFTYGAQPVLRAATPRRVPVWGGTRVVVEGGDLGGGVSVRVGAREVERATLLADGCDALLELIAPAGEGEGLPLSFTNAQGVSATLPDAIDYVRPTLTPPEGLRAGYTNLTLRGVDLREGLAVRLSGAAPRALERVSDEEWRLLTPRFADFGPAEVQIYNADGRGLTARDLFSVNRLVDEGPDALGVRGDCNDARAADLSGDGRPDVILAMGSSSPAGLLEQPALLLLNDGAGGLEPPRALSPVGNGMNVKLGDVDDDGDLDALMLNLFSARDFFWLNDGSGGLTEDPAFAPFEQASYDGELFDADGDGDLDAFLMQTGDTAQNDPSGRERLLLREGARWVERSEGIDFNVEDVHDHDMNHVDLNGDGLDDVVIVVDNLPQSFPGASNRVLINRGGGVFERARTPINNYPGDWLDVAVGDINGDGDPDVILPQDYIEGISIAGTPPVALFMGDGRGGLVDESYRVHGMPPSPAFGATPLDLDADGDLDLMVSVFGLSYGDGTIDPFESVLLLNDGAGDLFEANASFEEMPLSPTAHMEPVDLDGDGRLDMFECAAEGASRVWRQLQEP